LLKIEINIQTHELADKTAGCCNSGHIIGLQKNIYKNGCVLCVTYDMMIGKRKIKGKEGQDDKQEN